MSLLPAIPSSPTEYRRARHILTAVVLIHIALFAITTQAQIRALFAPAASRPQVDRAVIAGIDPHGYYAWLRSPLIDGDWEFTNEYDFYRAHWEKGAYTDRTPTGRAANQWSVGPALVWSAGVVPVHLALTAAGAEVAEPRGYSPPYQLAVGLVTLVLGLATVLFVYRLARLFAPPVAAAAGAGVLVLGTSVVGYGAVQLAMAHGPATAALAGVVWAWAATFGSTRPRRWFAIGLLLGVTCLMRWQLATFAVLPALEAARLVVERRRLVRPLALGVCAALGAFVAFTPQMAAWWVVYGQPIVNPHPTQPQWLSPSFWAVLFSPERSLFYWTPVALLGTVGLLAAAGRGGSRAAVARILLVAGAIQIYLMATLIDRGVSLGFSFGFRFLTETVVILALGLAVLFRSAPRIPVLVAVGCGVAVCWNLLQIETAIHGIFPLTPGPRGQYTAVRAYFVWKRWEALVLVALAVWFALCLFRAFRVSSTNAPDSSELHARTGILSRLLSVFPPATADTSCSTRRG